MTKEMIKEIVEHLGLTAGAIGSIGVIIACRKYVVIIWRGFAQFFTAPYKVQEMLVMLAKCAERSTEMDNELKKITYALFNGGNEGVCNQIARLSACQAAAFEAAPYPSFECTSSGVNTRVNEAYRILTQVWSADTISAGRWHQVTHGELVDPYNAEFERCAAAKEDFIGTIDIKNPMTDSHRGRWRIHAPAAQIGDDCLYVGRFIAALDDTAKKIAKEEGWSVKIE